MERSGDEDGNRSKPVKAKSCKGTLYYSSILKSKGLSPNCFGLSGTLQLQQVPKYVVGESEVEATKEGQTLTDFRYVCVGHSVYLEKDSSDDGKKPGAELPACDGLKILVDKTPDAEHASAHAQTKEADRGFPQLRPQPPTPAQPIADGFLTKFTRNGSLVASGVGRNMCKVGNYVKDTVDMLYPFRKRPK